MGFLANPLVIGGIMKLGGAIGGSLLGKKRQDAAMKRSPEEQQALSGATGAAGSLLTTGQSLIGGGQQAQAGPMAYYNTLLRGSRPAMSQATAGARAGITDTYRGAERSLEHAGVQGAQRQVASGDLARDRASKIAGLTTGVQPYAADALAQMGGQQVNQGIASQGNAAGIYSGLLGSGFQNRVYGREEGGQFGQQMGGLIFDLLSGGIGKGGTKGPKDLGPVQPGMLPGWSSGGY